MKKLVAVLVAIGFGLSACEPLDEGGGGGVGGDVTFRNGFVFVRNSQIWMADSADDFATATKLTSFGENAYPSVSKDGRTVVFVSGSGPSSELQLVNTDAGASARTLLAAEANQRNFRFPVFSPDGLKIVFAYEDSDGSSSWSALGTVNSDGSGFRTIVGGTNASYTSPTFDVGGNQVLAAAGSASGNYNQIVSVNVATGSVTSMVTLSSSTAATAITDRLAISPDGTKAAFAGRVSGKGARIFVVDLNTEALTQITEHTGESTAVDSFPTWRSATELGFSAQTAGADNVYVISPSVTTPGTGTLKVPSATQPAAGQRAGGTV